METIETLGKYEIKRPLGRGAMGTVYEGWDPIIARRVAIKTVRLPDAADPETEEALARFRREAQAAGRLTHPNIVGVFDYGETKELAYIVMEYVDGPPLKAILDKQERFALADIVRIMQDLLSGLQFSHERGVVHRDIKPANVMLTTAGQAKIADFGIARIESSSMTQAGTVLGTPAYMSPEQFMGQVVDSRTDIYSSGVLLYQLLTGERPFEGGMSAIMHKALNTEPPAPSQLSVTAPPSFDAVVRKAMAKRPEDRFASATAFLEAVRVAVANPGGEPAAESEDEKTAVIAPVAKAPAAPPSRPAAPAVPAARPAAVRSPLPLIAAAALVVLLALGGGGWWFLLRSPAPVQTAAVTAPPVIGAQTPPAPPPPANIAASTPTPPNNTGGSDQTPAPSSPATQPAATQPAPVATLVQPPPPPASAPITQPAATQPPPVATPVQPPPPPPSAPVTQPAATQLPPVATPVQPPPPSPPVTQPPQPAAITPPPTTMTVGPRPPQPLSATTSADRPQLAMVSGEALRRQIAQWISGRNCALLGGDVRDTGGLTVSGLAGDRVVDDLRQGITSLAAGDQVDWRVSGVNPVYCPTLDALRPLVPAFAATGGPRLSLQMADGNARLHDGDLVKVRLVMPDFPARLYVDYIAHDGSVQHLYPQLADPKNGIAADPTRVYSPGERVNLGNPAWTISEPYGTDMIIAVASSEPLFPRSRQGNAETADVYVRDLQAAIDAARQRGVRLAAAAVTLEALAK